jgi:4-alpha-glucanotransferase
MEDEMDKRSSGILMHITSLPSRFGIGDLGPEAYHFADFLIETKQTYWQLLHLNPTSLISGNSPYASYSAFAGNTLLISSHLLMEMGLLQASQLAEYPTMATDFVDYRAVIREKNKIYHLAYEQFKINQTKYRSTYDQFCTENAYWLSDFARFMTFKIHFKEKDWGSWPAEIKNRQKAALTTLEKKLIDQIDYQKFLQYIFFRQWESLRKYCNERGIRIIGDIPYYVNYDSAEVWTNPQLFKLDENKKPAFVAGVPPDYFSATGQLWGNPVYYWDKMKTSKYAWWIERIRQNLRLYDIIRIDHFRGFLAYWEVPASETTAIKGQWIPVPGNDIFRHFQKVFPNLPILAEDLGVITDDVRELMKKFHLPGMRILVFAFDDSLPRNSYALHNHIPDCVVYTGTHDNNTVRGWFMEETSDADKRRIYDYLGREVRAEEIHWEFIRLAMMSVANTVIFPLQDILGLDSSHRMNTPATLEGNWKWRMVSGQIIPELREKFRHLMYLFRRERS